MQPLKNIDSIPTGAINPFQEVEGNRDNLQLSAFSEEIKIDFSSLFWKTAPYAAGGAGIGAVVTTFFLWATGQPIAGTYVALGGVDGGVVGAIYGCSDDLIDFYKKCKTNYKFRLIQTPFRHHIQGLTLLEWQSCMQKANAVYLLWIKQIYPQEHCLADLYCPINKSGIVTFPVRALESDQSYEFEALMKWFAAVGYTIVNGVNVQDTNGTHVSCPMTRKVITKEGLQLDTEKMEQISEIMGKYLCFLRKHIRKAGLVWNNFVKDGIKAPIHNVEANTIFIKLSRPDALPLTLDEASIVVIGAETYKQAILQRNTQVYAAACQALAQAINKDITPSQEQAIKKQLKNWYNQQKSKVI